MKVLLIVPGIDNEYGKGVLEANRFRSVMPMLAMPYIAALTPPDIQVEVIDEEHGLMTQLAPADLVGLTGMTMSANRMYRLADAYRAMGIPVVLGGIHVSYMPEEAAAHADALVLGEADEIWPQVIRDFQAKRMKPIYRCSAPPSLDKLPPPRLDLVDGPRYRPPAGSLNTVMATRGCPHNCHFCCVSKMFGRKIRVRPVQSVVAEIAAMNDDLVVFADDNLIGNPNYAKELLTSLIPLRKQWFAQMSIKIAENPDLLKLAAQAGCKMAFIGFESLNPDSIVFVNKQTVNAVAKYQEAVQSMHDHGVRIFGSFIVGCDHDTEDVFAQTYDFIVENHIEYPVVNVLTPLPGTELHRMLREQGRIIDDNWDKYNFANVVYQPKNMTPEQLQFNYDLLLKNVGRRYAQRVQTRQQVGMYSF